MFLSQLEKDDIYEVEIGTEYITFTLRSEKDEVRPTAYVTQRLPSVELTPLVEQMKENNVTFTGDIVQDTTGSFLLSWIIMPIMLFALFSLLLRFIAGRSGGGGGGGFGGGSFGGGGSFHAGGGSFHGGGGGRGR